MGYDIDDDADLNKYETDDIEDLTLANIGEFGRAVAVFMALIVLLLVIGFIIKWIKTQKKTTGL